MTAETLSATRPVAAPPDMVFAVLADPTTHPAINGSVGAASSDRTGWVTGAVDPEPLTVIGQVFRMGMCHPDHPDGDYRTANQVRELDPPRRLTWATGTEDDVGRLSFGGWLWRYDLVATGRGTDVTLTYDWSQATPEVRRIIGFPPFGVDHLAASLDRLAAVVADRAGT